MSKAVMLSIRPKWVEKIASGEKTIPNEVDGNDFCSYGKPKDGGERE